MDWTQITTLLIGFLGFIVANFGMFLWSRSEAKASELIMLNLIIAIKDEIKDFHGRLCAIEEKRKK